MKIAVVGATGMVGKVMLEVLAERKIRFDELILVASERSVGKKVSFQGTYYSVVGLNEAINLNFSDIGNNKLFYDVIYNPSETNFLKEGKKLGNRSENGKLMFIYQALEAFKLWHGLEPKINQETLALLEND